MCKKKIFGAVIGTALAMGASAVYAASTATITAPSGAPFDYANEQFDSSGTEELPNTFTLSYVLGTAISGGDIYVTFKLDNDVKWSSDPMAADLAVTGDPGLSPTARTEDSVTYLLNTGDKAITSTAPMAFSFKVKDVYALANDGTELKITAKAVTLLGNTVGEEKETVYAKSKHGVEVECKVDSTYQNVAIDVASGSKVFVNAVNSSTASLGTINIKSAAPPAKTKDGNNYVFDGQSGSLTIIGGPFNASKASPGAVFIDEGSDKTYDSTTDFGATVSDDGKDAEWAFTSDNLKDKFFDKGAKSVLITVDGDTPIDDNDNEPSATMQIVFQKNENYPCPLEHIKNNGSVCTVFNVPPVGAQDEMSLRITNKTSSQTGVVLGTLRDKEGEVLFEQQPLQGFDSSRAVVILDKETGPGLLPKATIRITSDNILTVLRAAKDDETATWKGRAVLTISSDLTSMEVFNLLRTTTDVVIKPLLNLSVGASGNGCD